jgi:hypothetical protein
MRLLSAGPLRIPGTRLPYFISENGQFYRMTDSGSLIPRSGSVMKIGYRSFCIDNRPQYAHRLVATMFLPNPEGKPEVNHKDGNKLNNHVSNLEWVTSQENNAHAERTGLRRRARGERVYTAKLTNAQVLEILEKAGSGCTQRNIAAEYGVEHAMVGRIVRGDGWNHVTGLPRRQRIAA